MEIREITKEEALASENRSYNAYEWERSVNRYSRYMECKFYESAEVGPYGSKEVYANYLMNDGIRTMQRISYHSCLSNSAFVEYTVTSIEGTDKLVINQVTPKGFGYPNNNKVRKDLSNLTKIKINSFFSTDFTLWMKK